MNPVKILHITPGSNGYQVVELLANRMNSNNHMAVIKYDNGDIHFTGGFLINDTPEIRSVLDSMPKDKQYEFVKSFKMDPFAKMYYHEDTK